MELIGLDIGQAKTGLARASTIARLAEPIGSVETLQLMTRLNQMIKDHDVQAVIVGLPRNLKNEDTDQTRWVRDFVERLKTEVKSDFYWQDEALTTALSQELKDKTHDDHELAARTILQDWIDTPESERVRC